MFRIYSEVCKKSIKIFLFPAAFPVLLLIIIIFTVTDLRSCTAGYTAMICQQFFSWSGIFLLSPVFMPEQKDNIQETILSKSVPIKATYLIRFAEALAMLLLFTAGFVFILSLLGNEIDFKRYFIHTLATALLLGSLGFAGTRFTSNIGVGYIIAFGFYIIQMFLPDRVIERAAYIYIFTLRSGISVVPVYIYALIFIIISFSGRNLKIILCVLLIVQMCMIFSSCNGDVDESKNNINLKSEVYSPTVLFDMFDFSQKNNYIYVADKTQILIYDTISGDEKLFANGFSAINFIYTGEDYLYVFDSHTNEVITLSYNDKTAQNKIEIFLNDAKIKGLLATDNYIILSAKKDLKDFIYIIDKINYSIEEQTIPGINSFKEIIYETGDNIFIHYESGRDSTDNYYILYNIKENKLSSDKYHLNLVSTFGKSYYLSSKNQIISSTMNALMENSEVFAFNLADESINILHKSPISENHMTLTSGGQNIISWYDEKTKNIYFHDITKEHSLLTILINYGCYTASIEYYINEYEKQTDTIVQTVIYHDLDKLRLKLLANENDFDLYLAEPFTIMNYVKSGAYEDLYIYDNIKNSISSEEEALFEKLAFYENKMYGVPYETTIFSGDTFSVIGSVGANMAWYLSHHVNLLSSEYTDRNAIALTQVYENIQTKINDLSYIDNYELIASNYILMNPASKNKQKAVDFLSGYIKFLSRQSDISGAADYIQEQIMYYPDNTNFNNILMFYNICHIDMQNLFRNGYENVLSSKQTVDEAAKEVSNKINMIINE